MLEENSFGKELSPAERLEFAEWECELPPVPPTGLGPNGSNVLESIRVRAHFALYNTRQWFARGDIIRRMAASAVRGLVAGCEQYGRAADPGIEVHRRLAERHEENPDF